MSYAEDPARLARLLRNLADALDEAGVNPSGSSNARHLMDDARRAAREIDPESRARSSSNEGWAYTSSSTPRIPTEG